MNTPSFESQGWLDRYRPWQKIAEPLFWVVFFCANNVFNSVISWIDVEHGTRGFLAWEPITWEWSSGLMLILLVPAVIAFERRFPLRVELLRQNIPFHLAASAVFSVVHVVGMVGLRKIVYATHQRSYDFGDWPRELAYEYLKDFRTYFLILVLLILYRLVLLRMQGEARLLDAPDTGAPVEAIDRPERFLVRKLGKEFLLPAAEIEWLQAMGNYVNLRVRGRDYPLRTTMADIENRLDPGRFVRVHRSHMVNLDCVAEIEPVDSGDARVKMRDGTIIPASRRYRQNLRPVSTNAGINAGINSGRELVQENS